MASIPLQRPHRIMTLTTTASMETVLGITFQRLLPHQPEGKQRRHTTMTVTAIHACETQAPENRERTDWRLLMNLPDDDLQTAVYPLERNGMRWQITVLQRVLKSRCRAKHSRLHSADRLTTLFVIFLIIARQVFWLLTNQREDQRSSPFISFIETKQNEFWRLTHAHPESHDQSICRNQYIK
jgi:hypothetical protein